MVNCNLDLAELFKKYVRFNIIHIREFTGIGVRFYDCYWDLIIKKNIYLNYNLHEKL